MAATNDDIYNFWKCTDLSRKPTKFSVLQFRRKNVDSKKNNWRVRMLLKKGRYGPWKPNKRILHNILLDDDVFL